MSNLSGDLKKVNPSKRDELGMVDLSGFEQEPTKHEKEEIRQIQIFENDSLISYLRMKANSKNYYSNIRSYYSNISE